MITKNGLMDVLDKVVAGQRVNEDIGDWVISNLNNDGMVDLMYVGKAIYVFSVREDEDCISFYNYHREGGGVGTISLIQLHSSFEVLSRKRQKKLGVVFDSFGQKDTEQWLLSNGYEFCEGSYQKMFYGEGSV